MRIAVVLCLGLFVCLCAQAVFAHPPVKIDITYASDSKIVTAVITHPVENPVRHHIGKVDVSLNGKEIIEHAITVQDNKETQTVTYRIPDAKPGDTIGVEAHCNISGSLENKITVK